jgi:hypothetical protein
MWTNHITIAMAQSLGYTIILTHAALGVKRDLLQCQKRPATVSKETYYHIDTCGVRRLRVAYPTTVSKETYYSVKRDLLQCQKRPTTVGVYV